MAFPLSFSIPALLLLCFSATFSSAADHSHLQLSGLSLCSFVDCVNGECVGSSSFPFFECRCNSTWASPFTLSYLPCVLPNCTIDLGCSNSSNKTPPAAVSPNASGDVCALPVCGNGACIPTNNSSTRYQCKCDAGYTNLFNTASGYCLRECSIGGDCENLNVPLIGPPTGSKDSPTPNTGSRSSPLTKTLIGLAFVALVRPFVL